ncbi:MAG: hypothetical protein ABW133_22855 [Polyangiaceae bacterium]
MKKIQLLTASSLVLAMCILHTGCMTEVGTDTDSTGPSAEQPSKASDEAMTAVKEQTPNVGIAPAPTGAERVWQFIGADSCFDLCGRPDCSCLAPLCPGTPVTGEACNFSPPGSQCFTRPRPRSLTTFIYSCG